MKDGLQIWTLLLAALLNFTPASAANGQNALVVYRSRTPLYLKFDKPFDSSNSFTGEPVEATLLRPSLGFSSGTKLVGIVEIARPANLIPKSLAELRLGFNEVRLPTGEKHRITSPLKDLGLSRVRKTGGQTEVVQLDKTNLIARSVFRLGGIAVSKSDKKRVQINSRPIKGELADSFSPDAFTRYRIEGVELRPTAGELLDKIEAVFEQPLRIEKHDTGVAGVFSRGIISGDGTPTIVIGSGGTVTETLIVHELSHLDQRIRKFPNGINFQIFGFSSIDVS